MLHFNLSYLSLSLATVSVSSDGSDGTSLAPTPRLYRLPMSTEESTESVSGAHFSNQTAMKVTYIYDNIYHYR